MKLAAKRLRDPRRPDARSCLGRGTDRCSPSGGHVFITLVHGDRICLGHADPAAHSASLAAATERHTADNLHACMRRTTPSSDAHRCHSPDDSQHTQQHRIRHAFCGHCGRALPTYMCSEIIFLTVGPPLMLPRAVSARTTFSPDVQISGLLLGLTQTGNTGGATLNTCNAN